MSHAAEPADESLMASYAAGDMAAFELLYERHAQRVWRYLLRNLGDRALADDLTQDIWFAVARHAPRYQPSAKFTTWLFTLAHHRMVDSLRAARKLVSLDETGDNGDEALVDRLEADERLGPLQQLQSREQATALLAALEQLPVAQREAFLLQAEGGMGVEEIAATTGVSFETAKSRLRYARARLRQLLMEYA
jgi:RNA polymerase sigma factor (sigma-70 family)